MAGEHNSTKTIYSIL